jgi:hypothetical protein
MTLLLLPELGMPLDTPDMLGTSSFEDSNLVSPFLNEVHTNLPEANQSRKKRQIRNFTSNAMQ